jgi:crooked neck
LDAWKKFEVQYGTAEDEAKVQEMMPTTRKKWRKAEDGVNLEECEWIASMVLSRGQVLYKHTD